VPQVRIVGQPKTCKHKRACGYDILVKQASDPAAQRSA
jgi:hypothetical protein